MKGKKFAEVFASLVKTVAIASVSESSDWYNYQTKAVSYTHLRAHET